MFLVMGCEREEGKGGENVLRGYVFLLFCRIRREEVTGGEECLICLNVSSLENWERER